MAALVQPRRLSTLQVGDRGRNLINIFDFILDNPAMVKEQKKRVDVTCFGREGFDSDAVKGELLMQYFLGYRDALSDLRAQKIANYGEFPG